MASNYEKEPIFLQERTWDDNTKLPEKYRFQGTNTWNKAEIYIDSGTLGMEFFLERTLQEFNQAGTKLNPAGAGWSLSRNSRMPWAMDIAPPGSRSSVTTSPNHLKTSPKLLTRKKIAIRRDTSIAQSLSLFARYSGTKNPATGSTYTCIREVIVLLEKI
jgi:hypothetical protein